MEISTSSRSGDGEMGMRMVSTSDPTPQPQSSPSTYPVDPSRLPLIFPEVKPPVMGVAPLMELEELPQSLRKITTVHLDSETCADTLRARAGSKRLQILRGREKRRKHRQMNSLLETFDKSLRLDDVSPALSVARLQRAQARNTRGRATAAAVVGKEEVTGAVAGGERLGKGEAGRLQITQGDARRLRKRVEAAKISGAVVDVPEISVEEGKLLTRKQAQKVRKRIKIAMAKATGGVVKGGGAGDGRAVELRSGS